NAQHLSGGGSQTYLGASSAELTLGPGDWMQQQAQTPVQDHGSTMISPAEWFQQQAIQASEQQLQQGYGQRRLQTDELSVVESEDGRRYVNVDVTTPEDGQRRLQSNELRVVVIGGRQKICQRRRHNP
ncbi:hypothetical protein THAOC_24709, partial [Thalassiosira oceanica]